MSSREYMIKRIINTLNTFKLLNFLDVGECDINCEHIRNEDGSVLIYVYSTEVKIKLYNYDAERYRNTLYDTIILPYVAYPTFTSLMCIIFATIKEYYDKNYTPV